MTSKTMVATVLAAVILAAGVPVVSAQERVVESDSPLPPRAADAPHPDGVVSAEQLTEVEDDDSTLRRNLELVIGVLLVCLLLGYAFVRRRPR